MRVCLVSPQIPSGPYGRRGYSFLKHLTESGHSVTLHCIDDPGPVPDAEQDLRALGVDVRPVRVPKWKRWGNCLLGLPSQTPLRILHCKSPALRAQIESDLAADRYDLLLIDRFRMAPYGFGAAERKKIPVVVDFPDALSLYYGRATQFPRRFAERQIDLHEQTRIPVYEKRILESGMTTLVCSEIDRAHLLAAARQAHVGVVPHTVDTDEFVPRTRSGAELYGCFTGTLKYFPNVDGLLWYYRDIHPLLGNDSPRINVVGYGAGDALAEVQSDARFQFTGFVDRMADHLWTNDIYLCPLRIGAGVRNKLLEAFAAGMASVSTTLGYEGIGVTPGDHLLVGDRPEDFANAVRFLMEHPEERARLGVNARRFVEQHHSPAAVRDRLLTFLAEVVEQRS